MNFVKGLQKRNILSGGTTGMKAAVPDCLFHTVKPYQLQDTGLFQNDNVDKEVAIPISGAIGVHFEISTFVLVVSERPQVPASFTARRRMADSVFKEYFTHSQFHGLRFVADSRRHWFERFFWFVCICFSWYGCYLLISSSWQSYVNNPLSFGTETTYINWNTSFFSVSVCENDNAESIEERANELFGDHDWNLNDVIKEITFFKGSSYTASEYCRLSDFDCPRKGLREFALMFRSKCKGIFKSCKWMGTEFECCKHFRILETELGPCYALNSIQVRKPNPIPLVSNIITGPGVLTMELLTPSNIYVHSPEDVPFLNTIAAEMLEVRLGTYNALEYGITEIVNEAEVQRVDISRRRCRYPEENDLVVYDKYSYTACVTECRAKEQMILCNCSSHFTPRAENSTVCNLDGLLCLDRNSQHLTFLVNPWSMKNGLICSCLPGCSGTEFDLVKLTTTEVNFTHALVDLALERLPSVRLKRSVVRSNLDLVVSMGGTVGLFVGASLLSFVEILYFFTLRAFGTLRMRKGERWKSRGRLVSLK